MLETLKAYDVLRVHGRSRVADVDHAAAEEPLEVRLHGRPFAVIMRTPGADRQLAAGFLLAERVLKSASDLGTIEYCADRREADTAGAGHDEAEGTPAPNVVNVTLAGRSLEEVESALAARRQVTTGSSCGLCGRLTIESLRTDVAPLGPSADARPVSAAVIVGLPDRLRVGQAVFDRTGGLHAAGLFTLDGGLEAVAEDVGRHNAVDKVVGGMLMLEALPLADRILFVSGRASFEIVQKGLVAGVPIVGSVSAPSSLAVDLAREVGMTLLGFVRGQGFNIYSHPERVEA